MLPLAPPHSSQPSKMAKMVIFCQSGSDTSNYLWIEINRTYCAYLKTLIRFFSRKNRCQLRSSSDPDGDGRGPRERKRQLHFQRPGSL
jgi:hypothetical protein